MVSTASPCLATSSRNFTKQRAYLSACINPQGNSPLTGIEFKQNGNLNALNLKRLVSWLLSQDSLRDSRCYWTLLSVPLKDSSLGDAYQTLETAWFSWYRWWKSRL